MLRSWRQFVFSCRSRLSGGSRISLGAYIKGIENIRVGRRCKVHADASIDASRSAGVFFGDGAVIGAGAVVTSDISANAVAVGVPAKQIKDRR